VIRLVLAIARANSRKDCAAPLEGIALHQLYFVYRLCNFTARSRGLLTAVLPSEDQQHGKPKNEQRVAGRKVHRGGEDFRACATRAR
jgi:hypothetical protein